MFREDFAFNCQDVFIHLGHIHVDSPKTLASQFPKVHLYAHLADLTYGWTWNTRYAWEFQRGRHNHPPPHIDARHTQALFCRCGFPISDHDRTPGEAVGAMVKLVVPVVAYV